jgi:hypothetical protein
VLAANAGESLSGTLRRAGLPDTWGGHAQAGETARSVTLVFFVLLLAYVVLPWLLELRADHDAAAAADSVDLSDALSGTTTATAVATLTASAPAESTPRRRVLLPRWVVQTMSVAVIAVGIASVVTIIDAGHSGATAVWGDVQSSGR